MLENWTRKKGKKRAAHHAVDLLRHLLEVVEAHAGGQRRQEGVADLLRNGVQDLLRVVALRLRRLRNLQMPPLPADLICSNHFIMKYVSLRRFEIVTRLKIK